MSKPVEPTEECADASLFSQTPVDGRNEVLGACRDLTDSVYEGLDVTSEIEAVSAQGLGETVLLHNGSKLVGLAVCHMGPGTEAGSGVCYVKFAAIDSRANGSAEFDRLLNASEALAASRGISRLVAGVNTARQEAYRQMLARGLRTDIQGVIMARSDDAGYNRPGVWAIDDWR